MPHTQVRFTIEATAAAVHSARRRITATVRSWGTPLDDELSFQLELVASELLTDGLLTAAGPMTVEATLERDFLVLGVLGPLHPLHGNSPLPQSCAADPGGEGRRGLALIEALCLFHGTRHIALGTYRWAVLALPTALGSTADGTTGGTRDGGCPEDDVRWSITPTGARLLKRLLPAMQ